MEKWSVEIVYFVYSKYLVMKLTYCYNKLKIAVLLFRWFEILVLQIIFEVNGPQLMLGKSGNARTGSLKIWVLGPSLPALCNLRLKKCKGKGWVENIRGLFQFGMHASFQFYRCPVLYRFWNSTVQYSSRQPHVALSIWNMISPNWDGLSV